MIKSELVDDWSSSSLPPMDIELDVQFKSNSSDDSLDLSDSVRFRKSPDDPRTDRRKKRPADPDDAINEVITTTIEHQHIPSTSKRPRPTGPSTSPPPAIPTAMTVKDRIIHTAIKVEHDYTGTPESSTATPPDTGNCGPRSRLPANADWRPLMTQQIRRMAIKQFLVQLLPPGMTAQNLPPPAVMPLARFGRGIESVIFDQAKSRSEYYQLLGRKVQEMRHRCVLRHQRRKSAGRI